MFRFYNPNPAGKLTSDCVVRAICRVTGKSWDRVMAELYLFSMELKEMPSTNTLWREYLRSLGFVRTAIPDTCPDCYTIKDFCEDHPQGTFILATGRHLVAVVNGDYYDTWDSGEKVPIYYWR